MTKTDIARLIKQIDETANQAVAEGHKRPEYVLVKLVKPDSDPMEGRMTVSVLHVGDEYRHMVFEHEGRKWVATPYPSRGAGEKVGLVAASRDDFSDAELYLATVEKCNGSILSVHSMGRAMGNAMRLMERFSRISYAPDADTYDEWKKARVEKAKSLFNDRRKMLSLLEDR